MMQTGTAPRLSGREIECLKWASTGKTSWEISIILEISERTVTFHLTNTQKKLQAVNRTQAIVKAVRFGLI